MSEMMMMGGGGPEPSRDGSSILDEVLSLLSEYQDVEQDAEDLAEGADIVARIRKLLAKQQQEADGMMQGKVTPRAMRRASGGMGGGAY
jgi:hypothetical protein